VEETFFRMLRNQEFDVAELSLSSYSVSLFATRILSVAIRSSPRARFAIRAYSYRRKAAIREPKDIIGKRSASPEFQMTAPV